MTPKPTLVKTGSTAPLKNVAACLDVANRIIARPPGVDGLGVFFGPSGYGKSKASLFLQNKLDAIYVEVFDFWTRKLFVEALLAELEVAPRGTIGAMMQQAIRLLKDAPNRLLIIDEADKLVDKNMIELVRDIYKGAKIPVLLVGEERLPEKLAQYERCENRVTAFGMANPCDVGDARVLGQLYQPQLEIADDLLGHIVSETRGVASRIVTTLAEVGQFCRTHGHTAIDKSAYSGAVFTGRPPRRGR
ncbi:AAA domain-containing protein [Devosia enhydra]|uniref:AAA domain-containing protein n=1 Tax=Devosia enhydra TaxID=665118 RepID=A0A1K2I119_9HYPH|nr:ATP-binding protein [Devosia enhydra]SFZ85967.1 AAA domain-containing protein [Devosia enhydra]